MIGKENDPEFVTVLEWRFRVGAKSCEIKTRYFMSLT